jgi:hypothetical protein
LSPACAGRFPIDLGKQPYYETGARFTDNTYSRATLASLEELEQEPQKVVNRLVSPLLRSLGSHQLPRWAWLHAETAPWSGSGRPQESRGGPIN